MAKLVFDENELTIGDLEDFEVATGLEMQDALKPVPLKGEDGKPLRDEDGRPEMMVTVTAKILKALVWIANRHENPEFTLEDARNVKVTELEIIRESGDDDNSGATDPKD